MTIKPNMEPVIVEIVSAHAGIRNVNLVLKLMQDIGPVLFDMEDYDAAIHTLLTKGEIIELEVELPTAQYRVKSLYFPKGTRFLNVKEAGQDIKICYEETTVSNNDQGSSNG